VLRNVRRKRRTTTQVAIEKPAGDMQAHETEQLIEEAARISSGAWIPAIRSL